MNNSTIELLTKCIKEDCSESEVIPYVTEIEQFENGDFSVVVQDLNHSSNVLVYEISSTFEVISVD